MKVYLIHFSGHYLNGDMLITTNTLENARKRARKALKAEGLLENNIDQNGRLEISITEIEIDKHDTHMIFNGDY